MNASRLYKAPPAAQNLNESMHISIFLNCQLYIRYVYTIVILKKNRYQYPHALGFRGTQ